ncbi:phage protein Gp36 family protein [Loktanella sp. 3ANDIMAR09]|uniref:phage protein Gp36 family protein n=1 Tax=Loktanella sp. 3ANDIMAR09 TaxID=1225657 RepID=UPI0007019047|nr:phage protein Gp36 family protein [Loktanella sp. 3ANDIMAR09]
MPELLTIDILLEHIDRSELDQVAGLGSHNTPDGRTLDMARIEAAIRFATDMAKGYLQKRYPFIADLDAARTPDLLQAYLSDIVRYRLRSRTGNRNSVSDECEQRFQDARDWLREVSRGIVNIDLSDVGDVAAGATTVNPGGTVRAAASPVRSPIILDGYLP